MYESPIKMITDDIIKDIAQKQDGCLVEYVHRVGFDVDKAELAKALAYDRHQYEKGYADGRLARDSEIVRCKNCRYYETDDDTWCVFHEAHWVKHENDYCSYGERRDDEVH